MHKNLIILSLISCIVCTSHSLLSMDSKKLFKAELLKYVIAQSENNQLLNSDGNDKPRWHHSQDAKFINTQISTAELSTSNSNEDNTLTCVDQGFKYIVNLSKISYDSIINRTISPKNPLVVLAIFEKQSKHDSTFFVYKKFAIDSITIQ